MNEKILVMGELDYINGHLRYGHIECEVDPHVWGNLSEENKELYLREYGKIVIDDYRINECGDIVKIKVVRENIPTNVVKESDLRQ